MKLFFSCLLVLVTASSAFAQTAVLEGRLVNSLSGDPIRAATVVVDELKRETVSGQDGTFRIDNVAPGTYHVWVRTTGYSSRRTEVTVTGRCSRRTACRSRPALPGSGIGQRRGAQPVRCFQPTSVLAGQELTKQLEMSHRRRRCENEPGVAVAQLRSGAVAAGHSGPRRRSRADSAGRSADERSVQPVGRSWRHRQPGSCAADRSRAGTGHAPVRRERDRRPREHHHRGHSDAAAWRAPTAMSPSISDPLPKKAGRAGDVQVGNGKFALHAGGGGRRSDDVDTPEGRSCQFAVAERVRQCRALLDGRTRAMSAAAMDTTTRNTASRSSRRGRCN